MTADERFDRIEHFTAGFAEERRKDREEYRQLWRDNQRQITDLTLSIAALRDSIRETRDTLMDAIEAETVRASAAEKDLRERVSDLVSAIGALIQREARPGQQ